MNGADPTLLCVLHFEDLDLSRVDWQPGHGQASGVEQQWVASTGATLTLFRPEPRTADDLLAADAASLLAGGTFRPGSPMREGDRLRGEITADAPAGPALLDVVAVERDDAVRRLVLQRPIPEHNEVER